MVCACEGVPCGLFMGLCACEGVPFSKSLDIAQKHSASWIFDQTFAAR